MTNQENPFARPTAGQANDTTNPYAPSAVASPAPIPNMVGGNGSGAIYRDGDLLVMHKTAILPDVCVKSNEPTTQRLKRKLMWHHPAIYLVILLNLIIYAIVAMCVRKTAEIQLPLSLNHLARRRRNMMIAWGAVLSAIAMFVIAIVIADSTPRGETAAIAVIMFIAAPFLLLIGALIGIYGCRMVAPSRIDEHYVWLKGCSPEYLANFPSIPQAGA